MGNVRRPKGSKYYYLDYYHNRRRIRESAHTDKKGVAVALLQTREAEILTGAMPSVYFERITFDELAVDLLTDYKINGYRSLTRAELSVKNLATTFGGVPVPQITTSLVKKYIEGRQAEGKANATINRELAALKRMLKLGHEHTPPKVNRIPGIAKLEENPPRQGFFEADEFAALYEALPAHLKGPTLFAYRTGWRVSEITGLTWSQVNRQHGTVRLAPSDTKNKTARMIYLDDDVKRLIEAQWRKRADGRLSPFVFLNASGTDRIKRFSKSWKTACRVAGCPGRHFHDLRRTAVRNLTRAGVGESVAMEITGHKTRSVFDRYNIVNDDDLRAASAKQKAYLDEKISHRGLNMVIVPINPASGASSPKRITRTPTGC